MIDNFVYGMDISSLPALEREGLSVFKGEFDLLTTLKKSGVNVIRLRLWNDPYTEDGRHYGGGTNDLVRTLVFAKRIQEAGLNILLDFHYSDFWADPGKQFMPKSWNNLNQQQLIEKIHTYTRDVLLEFRRNNINLQFIQPGNEITNGMMWPAAKLYENDVEIEGGFSRLGQLLTSAISACKEVYPDTEIIIHLDRGGDKNLYEHWFKKINQYKLDYDIIGLSYYPYWHGTLEALSDNIANIKKQFAKKVMIMETSYAYTSEVGSSPLVMTDEKIIKTNEWPPYPFTKEGQAAFLKDLISLSFTLKIHGLFYWEPAWLPVCGDTWATKEGREYIKENDKKDGNEWANQALFDVDGYANPALKVFNKIRGENHEK